MVPPTAAASAPALVAAAGWAAVASAANPAVAPPALWNDVAIAFALPSPPSRLRPRRDQHTRWHPRWHRGGGGGGALLRTASAARAAPGAGDLPEGGRARRRDRGRGWRSRAASFAPPVGLALAVAAAVAASIGRAGGLGDAAAKVVGALPPLPSPSDLAPAAAAASLVVLTSSLLRPLGLSGLFLVASARCLLQLSLLGGLVLSTLFAHNSAAAVLPYVAIIAAIASGEAAGRVRYAYPGLRAHALAALAAGCGSALAAAVLAVFRPVPRHDARTLVPIGGMLFGNAVSALALCADSLLSDLREGADRVELLLARGASAGEAAAPSARRAVRTALTPTVNALSVCGLVHIPGVMTGQILAGMDPAAAGLSQAAVMMLIATSSAATVLAAARLILGGVLDFKGHRIRAGRIQSAADTKSGRGGGLGHGERQQSLLSRFWGQSRQGDASHNGAETPGMQRVVLKGRRIERIADSMEPGSAPSATDSDVDPSAAPPIFTATDLRVPLTNLTVSFELRPGDRLAVLGRSGAGKTQLLRSLALLEGGGDGGRLTLFDAPAPGPDGAPAWRTSAAWVPQHRPTLPGTPRDLYEDAGRFRSQRRRRGGRQTGRPSLGRRPCRRPDDYASDWGLPPQALDRVWSSLSGGEARRASLAAALALSPEVLLLDEPTGGCDPKAAGRMERTLLEYLGDSGDGGAGRCAVMVTHSREQALRFCTHVLEIDL